MERVGEGFAVAEGEERMDVFGQDDVAPDVVALAVEVMQAVGDDWGEAWVTQGAGAVRGVEGFVELVGELTVLAGFGDVVPRRRIRGEASRAWAPMLQQTMSAKPVVEEFTRQRIGEAEGDEAGVLGSFCILTPPLDQRQSHSVTTSQIPNRQLVFAHTSVSPRRSISRCFINPWQWLTASPPHAFQALRTLEICNPSCVLGGEMIWNQFTIFDNNPPCTSAWCSRT